MTTADDMASLYIDDGGDLDNSVEIRPNQCLFVIKNSTYTPRTIRMTLSSKFLKEEGDRARATWESALANHEESEKDALIWLIQEGWRFFINQGKRQKATIIWQSALSRLPPIKAVIVSQASRNPDDPFTVRRLWLIKHKAH